MPKVRKHRLEEVKIGRRPNPSSGEDMRTKIQVQVLAALALWLFAQSAEARECGFVKGEERWGIKTSVVAGALDRDPTQITLESLMDAANPPLTKQQKTAIEKRLWAGHVTLAKADGGSLISREGDMVSVEGFLYRARCQKDGDFHLEIGTENKKGAPCLIVEAPDPGQVDNSALKSRVSSVRQTLNMLPAGIFTGAANSKPVHVIISGQLFLDAPHEEADPSGGRGTKHCATNIWEIHPVTDIQILQ